MNNNKDQGIDMYTRMRSAVIIPQWLNQKIGVYNGKSYIPVTIKLHMLGKKLGEFSWTTKSAMYVSKNKGKTSK